jgi:hypothetical protein
VGGPSGELSFAHGIVHRTVYSELTEARRRIMHAKVAEALERGGRPGDIVEVVRHAAAARDAGRAARACLAAARQHMKIFARRDASRVARRGLRFAEELAEPDRTKLSIELHAALADARTGEAADLPEASMVDALAERALDLGLLEHARLAFHVASYQRWHHDHPLDAERVMMRAEEVSREAEPRERAHALSEAALCLVLLERDLPKAEAWLHEAAAIARRESIEPIAIPDALAMLHLHRGELEKAEPLLTKARDLARREHDLHSEVRALENLVMHAIRRETFLDALMHAEELVRRLEREDGSGSDGAFARGLAATCRIRLGRVGAEDQLREALAVLRTEDAKRRLTQLEVVASEALLARDRFEPARALAVEALDLAEIMERPSDAAFARVLVVRASRAMGDFAFAEDHTSRLRGLAPERLSTHVKTAIADLLG